MQGFSERNVFFCGFLQKSSFWIHLDSTYLSFLLHSFLQNILTSKSGSYSETLMVYLLLTSILFLHPRCEKGGKSVTVFNNTLSSASRKVDSFLPGVLRYGEAMELSSSVILPVNSMLSLVDILQGIAGCSFTGIVKD